MKKHILMALTVMLATTSVAFAKDKTPDIQANTSSVSNEAFINNIAKSAIGMGAKEPVSISESNDGGKRVLVVAGSNGTSCRVGVSDGAAPQIMTGFRCK